MIGGPWEEINPIMAEIPMLADSTKPTHAE
jgi:hypothetical protein